MIVKVTFVSPSATVSALWVCFSMKNKICLIICCCSQYFMQFLQSTQLSYPHSRMKYCNYLEMVFWEHLPGIMFLHLWKLFPRWIICIGFNVHLLLQWHHGIDDHTKELSHISLRGLTISQKGKEMVWAGLNKSCRFIFCIFILLQSSKMLLQRWFPMHFS